MRAMSVRSAAHQSRWFLLLAICAVGVGGWLWAARSSFAQEAATEHKVLPFDESLKRDLNIPKILRGDSDWKIADHLDFFTRYFNTYTFAEMTQPENISRLPELRQTFYKKAWLAKDVEAFKKLNEVTLKAMQDFVNPRNNFHPAVQYNAAIILGDLDASPRGFGARIPKPVPWPGAVKTLVACATLPAFPDHVRAAALIGLERQAEHGLNAENREAIAAAMRQVVQEKTPPAGRDRDAHDWMRRRACSILGNVGQTGGDNNIPILLIDTMNDPQATLAYRCSAAQALGKLKYEGALGIDAKKLAGGMGDLTLAVCNDAKQRANSAGEDLIARQAALRLNQLKTGLAAPTAVGGDEEKSLAKDVTSKLDVLLKELQSGAGATESLDRTSRELAQRLGKAAPAAVEKATPETTPGSSASPAEKQPPAADPFGGADPF